jgi:cell wall-associated NlpC family hydrolase
MNPDTRRLFSCIAAAALCCCLTAVSYAAFSLSAGVFPQPEAEAVHQRLAARGYPVYILYGEAYEVRLGAYATRDQAEAAAEKLKSAEKIMARVIEEEDIEQSPLVPDISEDPGTALRQDSSAAYKDPRAQRIVSLALDLFGQPYKYGGTRVGKGIDCSFFVQTIFKDLGIALPRTARDQFLVGTAADPTALKVGDLVFFKKTYYGKRKKNGQRVSVTRINHVGIYIGNGEFIHATINAKRVTISRLDEPYFVKRFAGARRVLTD